MTTTMKPLSGFQSFTWSNDVRDDDKMDFEWTCPSPSLLSSSTSSTSSNSSTTSFNQNTSNHPQFQTSFTNPEPRFRVPTALDDLTTPPPTLTSFNLLGAPTKRNHGELSTLAPTSPNPASQGGSGDGEGVVVVRSAGEAGAGRPQVVLGPVPRRKPQPSRNI